MIHYAAAAAADLDDVDDVLEKFRVSKKIFARFSIMIERIQPGSLMTAAFEKRLKICPTILSALSLLQMMLQIVEYTHR